MKFRNAIHCSYCGTQRLHTNSGKAGGVGVPIKYKPDVLGYICSQCDGNYVAYRVRDLVKRGYTIPQAQAAYSKRSFIGGIYRGVYV